MEPEEVVSDVIPETEEQRKTRLNAEYTLAKIRRFRFVENLTHWLTISRTYPIGCEDWEACMEQIENAADEIIWATKAIKELGVQLNPYSLLDAGPY